MFMQYIINLLTNRRPEWILLMFQRRTFAIKKTEENVIEQACGKK